MPAVRRGGGGGALLPPAVGATLVAVLHGQTRCPPASVRSVVSSLCLASNHRCRRARARSLAHSLARSLARLLARTHARAGAGARSAGRPAEEGTPARTLGCLPQPLGALPRVVRPRAPLQQPVLERVVHHPQWRRMRHQPLARRLCRARREAACARRRAPPRRERRRERCRSRSRWTSTSLAAGQGGGARGGAHRGGRRSPRPSSRGPRRRRSAARWVAQPGPLGRRAHTRRDDQTEGTMRAHPQSPSRGRAADGPRAS